MKKKVVITEEKLVRVIREVISENQEMHENLLNKVLDPLRNVYYGMKGAFKTGHGYDYMKYVSELRNIVRDLKRFDQPNEKIMIRLENIKTELQTKNIRQDLKDNLENAIDQAILHFRAYTKIIDKILQVTTARVKS